MKRWFLAVTLLACACAPARVRPVNITGRRAPSWYGLDWVDAKNPLDLKELKGRVVLMHWWTDGCPPCVDNLALMGKLYEQYGNQGLVVVAVYFPNPARDVPMEGIRAATQLLNLRLPVAADLDWAVLKRYWLTGPEKTSMLATVIIDAQGTVRYADAKDLLDVQDALKMEGTVRDLLKEAQGAPPKG